MNWRQVYFAKVAAALPESEKAYLLRTRLRRRAGGRKLTNDEIGALIGKPGYWVSGVCIALGSRSRVGRRKSSVVFTEQDAALFTQMWSEGVSCVDIGKRWGCLDDWASKRAHQLGLPKRNKTITNKQVQEIRRRLGAGETRREVGRALGISYATVAHYAKGVDVPPPKGLPSIFDGGLADRNARRGITQKENAAHFGVCRAAVGKSIAAYRRRLDARSARKPVALIPSAKPDMEFLRKAA